MKICEIETFGRGGLAHYVHNLSGALAERGHEVVLVTADAYELEDAERLADVQVRKPIARLTGTPRPWLPAWVLPHVRRVEALCDAFSVGGLVRRLRPDVVHVHCTNPIVLAYLARLKRAGWPVVYTAHNVTPHDGMRFERGIYARIHGLCDRIVAHSEFDRQRLLAEFSLPTANVVAVIPHGEYGFFGRRGELPGREDARRRLGLEEADEVVLFFGHIREYKGLDLVLEGWPAVLASRARARLVVAGDPVQLSPARRAELETWATRLGAVCRFEYIPFAEVAPLFVAADVAVMPYRQVSQSGVLFLALSLGLPVVTTRVGSLPETLHDGESALLVPPESAPALASALVRALSDRALCARLVSGGQAVADRHSWPAIAERTERLFAELVPHGPSTES